MNNSHEKALVSSENNFGEVIRMTGAMAKLNPIRFSTKYQDDETDLLYYGFRYYNASTGRWLSRDPMQEQGGMNLYGFVANDPIRFWDRFGLDPVGDWISGIYWHAWWFHFGVITPRFKNAMTG